MDNQYTFPMGQPQQQQGQNPYGYGSPPNQLNPGDQNPYGGVNQPFQTPYRPGPGFTQGFLPNILSNPFVGGVNAGQNLASFAGQAAPNAGVFQSQLYTPTLNAFELGSLASGHNLASQTMADATFKGRLGLQDAFNRIDAQYENQPFHSTRGKQMDDAGLQFAQGMFNMGNQYGNQTMQTAANLGLQRQQLATQNLPTAFGMPMQLNQGAQQSAAGLYNLAQEGQYGGLNLPMAIHGSIPQIAPTVVQGSGGGKK